MQDSQALRDRAQVPDEMLSAFYEALTNAQVSSAARPIQLIAMFSLCVRLLGVVRYVR